MTVEKLEELVSLNKTKKEIWDAISDYEKGYWLKIKTPHYEVTVRGEDFRKSLVKLMRDRYEECCKIIDNA